MLVAYHGHTSHPVPLQNGATLCLSLLKKGKPTGPGKARQSRMLTRGENVKNSTRSDFREGQPTLDFQQVLHDF
jgi:hypothetical protein